jgi:hypothetical protein
LNYLLYGWMHCLKFSNNNPRVCPMYLSEFTVSEKMGHMTRVALTAQHSTAQYKLQCHLTVPRVACISLGIPIDQYVEYLHQNCSKTILHQ